MVLTVLTLFSFVWVIGLLDAVFLVVSLVILALWLELVYESWDG